MRAAAAAAAQASVLRARAQQWADDVSARYRASVSALALPSPPSSSLFDVVCPYTQRVVASALPECAGAHVDAAVRRAHAVLAHQQREWSLLRRRDTLLRFAQLVSEHTDELASLDSLCMGKALTDARLDIAECVDALCYYAGFADKLHGERVPCARPYETYTRREPVGVVGAITPWNYPAMMVAWKIAPALACGNAVVLKPSELAPLSALRLAELADEAGFDGALQVLCGRASTGRLLSAHRDVDKVAFTGSLRVGRMVMAAASESNLKRVTLELGGKSAQVVHADADTDAVAAGVFGAIFDNNGQNCVAGSRLYVHRSVLASFVARLEALARAFGPAGDPFTEGVRHVPVVSVAHADRVLGFLERASAEPGVRVVCGGTRNPRNLGSAFIEPTIVLAENDHHEICREEVFGPVLVVMPFDSEDAVQADVNASAYGLGAAIWTADMAKAQRFIERTKAGVVWHNAYNYNPVYTPFGGYKQSGFGRDLGSYALQHYTETKAVCVNPMLFDSS